MHIHQFCNRLTDAATQHDILNRQVIAQMALYAAATQAATFSVMRIASDIGSFYAHINTCDEDDDHLFAAAKDLYTQTNKIAARAQLVAQLAMETSASTSTIASSTVMTAVAAINARWNTIGGPGFAAMPAELKESLARLHKTAERSNAEQIKAIALIKKLDAQLKTLQQRLMLATELAKQLGNELSALKKKNHLLSYLLLDSAIITVNDADRATVQTLAATQAALTNKLLKEWKKAMQQVLGIQWWAARYNWHRA